MRIKHNKKVLVAIIILAVILVVLLIWLRNQKNQEKVECKSDGDCVLQQTTCCSCNMGGKQECMSRQNASLKQEELKSCEANIVCPAVYNCMAEKCSCVNGECLTK